MTPLLTAARHRLEYAVFLAIGRIFGAMPVERASAVSGFGWRVIAPLTSRHRRATAHLRRAFPEKTARECDAIARAMWENLGRTFGEFFHLDEIAASDRLIVEDPNGTLAGISPDRGFIACAAHQGNWEIAVMGLSYRAVGVAGLYQRVKNPLVDALVRRKREKFYPGGLFEKRPASALRLMRHARDGGGVAILSDLRERKGLPAPFFGAPAPSTPFPATLARTLDVPLFAATMVREPGVRFRLRLDPVEVPRTADRDDDIARATARIHAAFEASIRRRPEQWMWAHRRWG